MTTTITHPSGLPEQEPTSPTAVVLCGDESWVNTAIGWESRTQWMGEWGRLRVFAAWVGGATLYDLADLPAGLTEVKKEVVTAKWESGDSDETWADLLRVACMDGASVVGTQSGVTHSGLVFAAQHDCVLVGTPGISIPPWGVGWTVTVTAPKAVDPTGGDPVVRASFVTLVDSQKCIFFRAQDGRWSRACDSERGIWPTDELVDIERLSSQTIAELMGGEQA